MRMGMGMRIGALALAGLALAGCGSVDHSPGAIQAVKNAKFPTPEQQDARTFTATCLEGEKNQVVCEVHAKLKDESKAGGVVDLEYVYRVTGVANGEQEIWQSVSRAS